MSTIIVNNEPVISEIISFVSGKSAEETLAALAGRYKNAVIFSSSLGLEDQVITHMIYSNNIPIKIFTIDTGRLFPETYKVLYDTNEFYNKKIEIFFPQAEHVQNLVNTKGPFSFYESVENRKECCYYRKVEPLNRALKGTACWVTGIRAEQSSNRQNVEQFEWDVQHGVIKYHPLLSWTTGDVKAYIKQYNIPYNTLHDKGFISIGCAPCTRAVKEGEDFRAGRWWWEDNSKKECGLHIQGN
jgi:phosphoadenosine phosphosulfate reductase